MSHIAENYDELMKIYECLKLIQFNGYSKKNLEVILERIIPTNNEYQVYPEINGEGYVAYFCGYDKKIHINEYSLKNYIYKMVEEVVKMNAGLEKYKNELQSYITLFTLLHEVEHVYQYMFGQGFIENKYTLVKNAYSGIIDFSPYKKYPKIWNEILIERYKQQKDKATFVLERNANVEAYDLLNKLSNLENIFEIQRFMNNQYLWYSAIGYLNMKNNGSFEESYRDIWRHKQYKNLDFSEEIPVSDRIRYGLPIENAERKKLLKKFISTK